MDATIVTALAGIVGSVCGGTASFATAWLTQKTRAKRDGVRAELSKREALYGEFIQECSKHIVDSLDRNLDKPERLLSLYTLLNRIRLCASEAVLVQALELVKFIMEQYFAPNLSLEEFHETRAQRRHRSAQGIQRSLPPRIDVHACSGVKAGAGVGLLCWAW